jgi:type IV secretion system protein TrbJ
MSRSNLLAAFAASICIFAVPAAQGGGAIAGATEPTQILNNLQLLQVASDGAVTASTTVDQYMTQLQQYQVQMQNIAKLPSLPAGLATDTVKAYNDLAQFKSALERLQGSLSQQSNVIEQRVTEARLGGRGWREYLASVAADAASKQKRAVERLKYEESVLKQVEADYTFARNLQAQIPATVGQHQSLQMLNSQMNRVVTQNAKLLEVVSGTLNARAEEDAKEAEAVTRALAEQEQLRLRQEAVRKRQQRFGGWE